MNADCVIPDWLHNTILGYGDPAAAHCTKLVSGLKTRLKFRVKLQHFNFFFLHWKFLSFFICGHLTGSREYHVMLQPMKKPWQVILYVVKMRFTYAYFVSSKYDVPVFGLFRRNSAVSGVKCIVVVRHIVAVRYSPEFSTGHLAQFRAFCSLVLSAYLQPQPVHVHKKVSNVSAKLTFCSERVGLLG